MPDRQSAGRHSWAGYRLVSAVIHQPVLLRLAGRAIRSISLLESHLPVVARHRAAAQILRREAGFSNTAYAHSLVAGPFAIGMDSGMGHAADRACLERVLPAAGAFGSASGQEAQRRVARLRDKSPPAFNLVDDYMVWVAWAAIRRILGAAASGIEASGARPETGQTDAAAMLELFQALRYVGAHLLIGSVAPSSIRARAARGASVLMDRIDSQLGAVRNAWGGCPRSNEAVVRNATGLMWVGHPATVQAGCLAMQELLGRPRTYHELRERAHDLGPAVWSDKPFRSCLRAHLLELLRFRPAFPVLLRDVARDTEFVISDACRAKASAGNRVVVLAAAAMFDPDAISHPNAYWPGRPETERCDLDDHYLIFGLGPRSCIAKEHVLQMLVSALIGLLTMPSLHWADPWYARIRYDGPIITRFRLTIAEK